jgi:hypothetical protein
VTEGLVEGFLCHILGILAVIGYPLGDGKNFLLVTKNQFLEGLRISALCCGHQHFVGFFGYIRCPNRFHGLDPPAIFPRKVAANRKAISMPGAVRDQNGLEVARNMADT